jgi:hypothetical protein
MAEKTKIEQLYDDHKSRGFVNHLIHSYLPVSKVNKVWVFEDKKPYHKCSICGQELIDIETVFTRVQASHEFAGEFADQVRKDVAGKPTKYEDRFMVKHVTHGAVMGWQGEKTTTNLCQQCIQDLLNMVTNGLLHGEKNITYQVNKMQRTAAFENFTSNPALGNDEIKVVETIQKKVETNNKHVMTLGDLDVLKDLKAKMDAEEAKKK